jgi:RHS repeat-associated protein
VSSLTAAGTTVAYTYNDDDQLATVGSMTLDRDPTTGFLAGTTLGSVTSSLTYDGFGQLATTEADFGTDVLFSEDFAPIDPATSEQLGPDALGRITAVQETLEGESVLHQYTYDDAGRLESSWEDGVEAGHYDYDPNGNRLAYDTLIDGATCLAEYDAQDRLVSCTADGFDPVSFTWDDTGALESETNTAGTTAYEYDVLGALRRVELPDGTSIEYDIDPSGRRIGRTHLDADGVTILEHQRWLYGTGLLPLAELNGAGAVESVFIYGSRANVPDSMITGGQTYRIISDVRGSVHLVVNAATGSVAQRIEYDDWGRVIEDTNPGFQPFGYAGGIYDPATELVRFGARDYDARVGRWTARDIYLIGSNSTNFYIYADGEPVNRIDIDGSESHPIVGAFTESLGAGVAILGGGIAIFGFAEGALEIVGGGGLIFAMGVTIIYQGEAMGSPVGPTIREYLAGFSELIRVIALPGPLQFQYMPVPTSECNR